MSSAWSTSSSLTVSGGMKRMVSNAPVGMSKRPSLTASSLTLAATPPPGALNSTAFMRPRPRTSLITFGRCACMASSRPRSCLPRACEFSSRPSSLITSIVATAAAQDTGLPPYVPPIDDLGALTITSRLQATALRGMPEAMPLARSMMSGASSRLRKCSTAKNLPVLPKPLWTSSATSRMPCSSHTLRSSRRYAGGGTTYPPSPSTGSTTIAAVSAAGDWDLRRRRSSSRGLLQQPSCVRVLVQWRQ
mmetsp:Transcript_17569/g.68145  ORF Transcript_17569/g.68145 Transcript_17569/m.68145 type:complete len:248 (+) Transcript_17569:60-803(+)